MTHPIAEMNENQANFLKACPEKERRFHELFFMVGNATYRYHKEAHNHQPSEKDWEEWLSGLAEPIKNSMRAMGFSNCLKVLSFTRYVNEKNDNGLEAYLCKNLGEEYAEYKKLVG